MAALSVKRDATKCATSTLHIDQNFKGETARKKSCTKPFPASPCPARVLARACLSHELPMTNLETLFDWHVCFSHEN